MGSLLAKSRFETHPIKIEILISFKYVTYELHLAKKSYHIIIVP